MMARRVAAGAKRRLWTPSEMTTALWLDAADASTITKDGNNLVSKWNDKSGNNIQSTQSLDYCKPVYTSSIINGLPVLSFDGSNDFLYFLTPNNLTANSEKSFFIVHKAKNQVGYDFCISTRVNFGGFNNDNVGYILILDSRSRYDHTAAGDSIKNNIFTRGNPYITCITVKASGSDPTHYVNGSLLTLDTNTLRAPYNDSPGYTVIGRQSSGYASGYCAEIVALASVATVNSRQKFEGYLAHKWGLSANLPANHPYKFGQPRV